MLDERRKAFLQRINVRSIKPNGVLWVFGEQIRTYQLTKDDIRYLRWYYNDPSIAYQMDLSEERKTYALASDRNKYNEKCRTKNRVNPNGVKTKIIVGSLLVGIMVGSAFLNNKSTVKPEFAIDINQEIANEDNIEIGVDRLSTIKHLCDIYQVDFNQTYRKLEELTDNFSGTDYAKGCIKGVTCKGIEVKASSEEELLLYAVRAIKQLPERFGLDPKTLYIDNGYESGTDYLAQISDICEILGLDRNLMYAIVQSECGFDSEMFNTINNPAGLRGVNGTDPWWVFQTKEEGFIELGMEMLKYYRSVGRNPSSVDAETIRLIGDIHAPLSDGNKNWVPNVLINLEYAQNNEPSLFNGEEVHGLGR